MNCKGRVITFLLLGCMIALAGCGPTNQDLVDQFSPGFAEMRTALQGVAGALPASVGGDQGVAQPPIRSRSTRRELRTSRTPIS